MEPSPNDVLSGRGASFNRHPGNENFRRMLDRQRAVYAKSAKTQKVAISKSIVETIYSMDPPGRFLRKCADTGQWEELSKKEALNKAAQAMAYAVRDMAKEERERSHSLPSPHSGVSRAIPSQITLSRSVAHASSAASSKGDGGDVGSNVASDPNNNGRTDQSTDNSTENPSLQRLLLQLQQSSNATLPTNQNSTRSMPVVSLNGLAQLLADTDAQLQQNQQRQRQLLLYLTGQRQLQPQTQLASALLPPDLSTPSPSLSAQSQGALLSHYDILRRDSPSSLLQGSYGTGSLQLSSLLGLQSITNQQDLFSSLMRGLPQNRSALGTEIAPRQPSVNQLQPRLDALLQNQLLSSSQNQLLLQQPSRPLDLLQQAWRDSVRQQQPTSQNHHNLTNNANLQSLISRRISGSNNTTEAESPAEAPSSSSSSSTRQKGREEDYSRRES